MTTREYDIYRAGVRDSMREDRLDREAAATATASSSYVQAEPVLSTVEGPVEALSPLPARSSHAVRGDDADRLVRPWLDDFESGRESVIRPPSPNVSPGAPSPSPGCFPALRARSDRVTQCHLRHPRRAAHRPRRHRPKVPPNVTKVTRPDDKIAAPTLTFVTLRHPQTPARHPPALTRRREYHRLGDP